jgi:hypothetical protein
MYAIYSPLGAPGEQTRKRPGTTSQYRRFESLLRRCARHDRSCSHSASRMFLDNYHLVELRTRELYLNSEPAPHNLGTKKITEYIWTCRIHLHDWGAPPNMSDIVVHNKIHVPSRRSSLQVLHHVRSFFLQPKRKPRRYVRILSKRGILTL